jgi:hypothetical protein
LAIGLTAEGYTVVQCQTDFSPSAFSVRLTSATTPYPLPTAHSATFCAVPSIPRGRPAFSDSIALIIQTRSSIESLQEQFSNSGFYPGWSHVYPGRDICWKRLTIQTGRLHPLPEEALLYFDIRQHRSQQRPRATRRTNWINCLRGLLSCQTCLWPLRGHCKELDTRLT